MEDKKDIAFEGNPNDNVELKALLSNGWIMDEISSKINEDGITSYKVTLFRSFKHGRPRVSSLLERL